MAIQKQFDKYYLSFNVNPTPNYVAQLNLYKGAVFVGSVSFMDKYPLPANKLAANDTIILHLHASMIDNIMNLVRYEKPLQIGMQPGNVHGFIGTWGSDEIVGEQEGV